MSIIVKAALKFQEGLSGLKYMVLESQNTGFQIKYKCIRKGRAVAGGLSLFFPKGKGPEVCRDLINQVSLYLLWSTAILQDLQPQISIKYSFLQDVPCGLSELPFPPTP